MKFLFVLLIIHLVSLYKAQSVLYCQNMPNPVRGKDCYYLTISTGDYKCCFIKMKFFINGDFVNQTACSPIDRHYYDNLDKMAKTQKAAIKKMGGIIESFDIDCSSNYLYIPLLSLMLFLL